MNFEIERYGTNGEGIALRDGKIVFIPKALCGESVEADLIKENKNFCIAKLNCVNSESKNRIKPVCPYYLDCGGCDLLHANYTEQLEIKKQIVKNNLSKFAGYNGEIKDVFPSDKVYCYRNHITFAVSQKGALGFFKNSTHEVIPVKYCYLADDVINKCIDIFNTYFFDNHLFGYNYKTGKGKVKQVDIKFLNNQLLITIVATTNCLPNVEQLFVRLNLLKVKYGVYISVNCANNTLIYGNLKHIYGIKTINSTENGVESFVSSFSFLQVNNYIKTQIYNEICDNVCGDVILDAYAGRGVLSAMLSKKAKKVYAIEIVEDACMDAQKMLAYNKIDNVEYICDDVEHAVTNLKEKIDSIILDPPRKGVSRNALESIVNLDSKKLVYLSCSSDTLGRDLKILMNNYKVVLVQPYDMFPNTANIETLVVMEKVNG